MHRHALSLFALLVLSLGTPLFAAADARPQDAFRAIQGVYSGEEHVLRLASMPLEGYDGAVYIELTPVGDPLAPMRQQIWAHRADGDRVDVVALAFPPRIEQRYMPSLADLAVGLWAAPEHFPPIDPSDLRLLGEVVIEQSGDRVAVESAGPFLVHDNGLRRLAQRVEIDGESLRWTERTIGGDAEPASFELAMERIEEPTEVEIRSDGLVIINLRAGRGVPLQEGDSALINFRVYAANGQLFDSTQLPGRKEQHLQPAPGPFIEGMRQGVLGMLARDRQAPEDRRHLRRVVIPPALGFADRGREPVIGPDEPIVVDLELITLRVRTR